MINTLTHCPSMALPPLGEPLGVTPAFPYIKSPPPSHLNSYLGVRPVCPLRAQYIFSKIGVYLMSKRQPLYGKIFAGHDEGEAMRFANLAALFGRFKMMDNCYRNIPFCYAISTIKGIFSRKRHKRNKFHLGLVVSSVYYLSTISIGSVHWSVDRNECNNSEQCVTCSDPTERNERNTPLGGVTLVTVVDLVPMAPFQSMGGTGIMTVLFSLPKNRGEIYG